LRIDHLGFAAMPPTPTQLAWRGRIEAVLRIAAPALDLVLAAGDRFSRIVEPEELEPPARRASFEPHDQRVVEPPR
jgi:hypothetical protein